MPLRIAITGSTGLIGSKIIPFLIGEGHQVTQITRGAKLNSPVNTPFITWDPDAGKIDDSRLEGFDVFIHLAGTTVSGRWTQKYKQSILDSRINGTRLIAKTLAGLKNKPKLFLSASAVGYYGNHAPEVVIDEQSPKGKGFLSDVCQCWESETQVAKNAGIRVINMRFGVVLSRRGGALAKMWFPFQFGLGGILGTGKHMMSWIALDEIPSIIHHFIKNEALTGAFNVTSPKPVSNKEFTKELGNTVKMPTIFPVPDFGIKLLFGEMGQVLLLEGAQVLPKRLLNSGYVFKYPDLSLALKSAAK